MINVKDPIILKQKNKHLIGYIKYVHLNTVVVDWLNGVRETLPLVSIRQATPEEIARKRSIPTYRNIIYGKSNSGKTLAAYDSLAKQLLKYNFKDGATLAIRSEMSDSENISNLIFSLNKLLPQSYENFHKIKKMISALNITFFKHDSNISEDYFDYFLNDAFLDSKEIIKNNFPDCSCYIQTQSILITADDADTFFAKNLDYFNNLFTVKCGTKISNDGKFIEIEETNIENSLEKTISYINLASN